VAKPPIHIRLAWDGALRFTGTPNGVPITIDGQSEQGPSPVQAAALGLAGCMAVDVVDILLKGRHTVRAFSADFTGQRAPEPPARFTAIALRFTLDTDAPPHAIQRAIDLSREKYCSVWHTFRQDIALETSYEVVA
jgi:putative redox protein